MEEERMVHGKFTRTPAVQNVAWFIDAYKDGKLDLEPDYQRRSVWTPSDKVYFLDTIFNGYPCPPVYMNQTIDDNGRTTYHVIDGKQRLETILKFANNEFALSKNFSIEELRGKRWRHIDIKRKRLFWAYIITVEQIDVDLDTEPKLIDAIFDRLNRNTKKLEAQELRHAKYNGWFINFVENITTEPDEEEIIKLKKFDKIKALNLTSKGKSKRMKDVQFISELLMIQIEHGIKGFNQDKIDEFYAQYDEIIDTSNMENEDIDEDDERPRINVSDIEFDFYNSIDYIYKMISDDNNIVDHIRSVGQFYTLFAYIILNKKDIDAISFAVKYNSFMNQVKEHRDNPNSESTNTYIIDYANSSVGASTDINRRTKRLNALTNYINEN